MFGKQPHRQVRCQQTGAARVLVDGFRSQKVLQTQASDRAPAFFKHKATGSASTELLLAWNTGRNSTPSTLYLLIGSCNIPVYSISKSNNS